MQNKTVVEFTPILTASVKHLFDDQIFFEKFHESNLFSPCKLGIFDKVVTNILAKNLKFVEENFVTRVKRV